MKTSCSNLLECVHDRSTHVSIRLIYSILLIILLVVYRSIDSLWYGDDYYYSLINSNIKIHSIDKFTHKHSQSPTRRIYNENINRMDPYIGKHVTTDLPLFFLMFFSVPFKAMRLARAAIDKRYTNYARAQRARIIKNWDRMENGTSTQWRNVCALARVFRYFLMKLFMLCILQCREN